MEISEIIKNIPKDKIYYQTDLGVLICADCLSILPLIPDNSVDLVLTDPPYNVNKPIANDNLTWEAWGVWFSQIINYFERFKRYYFFTGGKYLNKILPMTKSYLDCFVFYKPYANNRGFITEWNHYDFIIAGGGKDSFKKFKNNFFKYLEFPDTSGNEHPTSKPVKGMITIINEVSEINNLILDPFFGSGTTGVACEKLNRRWIGIEILETYAAIAKKRIKQEVQQMKLFK